LIPDPLMRVASKHRSVLGDPRKQQIAPKDSSHAPRETVHKTTFALRNIRPLENLIRRDRLLLFLSAQNEFRSTQNYVESHPVSIGFPAMRRFAALFFSGQKHHHPFASDWLLGENHSIECSKNPRAS